MTGGGSGGHITPLLSLAQELKVQEPNCQIVYIGHKGDQIDSLRISGHNFDFMSFVNGGKFRRYHDESLFKKLFDFKTLFLNIRDFFRVIKSIGTAYKILSRTQPDVLFAKGGFVSVPVGMAAKLKGIPIITHDSDTVGGLANKIVSRWAKVHATGMPAKYYKYKKGTVEYVGIPLDANIKKVTQADQKEYKNDIDVPEDSQVILVAGGGNGSAHLNDIVAQLAPKLLADNLAAYIIHVAGPNHLKKVQQGYEKALPEAELKRVQVFGFLTDFYKYSGGAELIISRAGATAIAEFAAQSKACIIIPSPFLAAGHQLKNAQMLSEHNAAVIVDEDATADELVGVISELLQNDHRRWELSKNLHKLYKPGAAEKLAKIILDLAKSKNG